LLHGLRTALQTAKKKDGPARREGLRVKTNGDFVNLAVEVIPLPASGEGKHYLILFQDVTRAVPLKVTGTKTARAKSTTAKELQSTNEELNTVNEELHGRNEELARINSDLMNLLNGVQMAIVIVSKDLRIRRFTPIAERILNLIPGDIGRPIGQIKPSIEFAG